MVKLRTILLGFILTFCFETNFAESIPVRVWPTDGKDRTETPVTGDYDKDSKELALKFSECEVYDVAVICSKALFRRR